MFIPDPGSSFLPIPDPKTAAKERGEKKSVVIPYHKFHIIENYFIFEMPKKNILDNFQIITELFSQIKFLTLFQCCCQQALKNLGLGSGIRKKTHSGSRTGCPGPTPPPWGPGKRQPARWRKRTRGTRR
jgi:hypothetical protein